MRISPRLLWVALAAAVVSCDDGASLDPGADPVEPLTATAIDLQSIQIRWTAVAGADRYILERRAELKGEFASILERGSRSQFSYLDRGLKPNTIYGYRLRAIDAAGLTMGTSSVAGARTAPEPGIEVSVQTVLGGEARFSIDSTGYTARVRLADFDQRIPVEITGSQLFQPLEGGTYQVTLEDLTDNCAVEGQQVRNVPVTAAGLNTIVKTAFTVFCRDRTRGRVRAVVLADGDTTDADGFRVTLSGLASDQTLPDSLRAVVIRQNVAGTGGAVVFDNVRPGSFSLAIDGVAPVCTVSGKAQRDSLAVEALGDLSETFAVSCTGSGGVGGDGPYAFRAVWEPDTAPSSAIVKLATTLDLGTAATDNLAGFQFTLVTTGGVVRLDSIVNRTPGFSFVGNVAIDGTQGTVIGSRIPGVSSGGVPLADFFYTVIGATGRTIRPQLPALSLGSANGNDFTAKARRLVGLFTIGTKQGSGTNQAPAARANGPYSGSVGSPIAFTAAGSGDADGSIASYAWNFGDGGGGTGQSPTHTYPAAGSYTATLTVTDDKGATGTSQAAVTVTTGGAQTTPFLWKGTFGTVSSVDNTVDLTVTLDLTADIPETAGLEALQDFVLDSLKWNPNVLEYVSFTFASGTGSLNFLQAANGRVSFRGTIDAAKSRGVITIGRVKYRVKGASGTTTTTATRIGSLVGTASLSSYEYTPRTRIEEATFTVGGGGGPTGTTVSGTVSSPQSGALAGVTVTLSGSGGSATTGATGGYTIGNVAAGSYTTTLSVLPVGCTTPPPANVTVASNPVTGVNFSVTCTTGGSTGTVAGTVTRQGAGGLSGVTVQVNGGPSSVTGSNGTYSIANVAAGSRTVSLATASLPSGCTPPSAQTVTVPASGTVTVNFAVNCTQTSGTGTITGRILFAAGSGTPSIAAAQVTVTPTAGSAQPNVSPDAQGNYARTNVPTSSPTGTVRVSGLPGGCTPANPTVNYTGLTAGATVAAPDIQITCPSTSNNYQFTITFSAISAGKTTMTAKIDMTTRNDPANNGAGPDKIGGFQATIDYPTARLSAPACTAGQLTGVINTGTAGRITPVLTNIPAGATGNAVLLFSCTFDVTGTGPTPIGVTAPAFGDPTGSVDFTAFVNLTLQDVP